MIIAVICQSAEQQNNSIFHRLLCSYQTLQGPLKQRVRIRINNGDKKVSFFVDSRSTAAELYRNAESIGMMNPMRNAVLCDSNDRIIPDSSIRLSTILPAPSLVNLVIPRQLILSVFEADQTEIIVHIINGDITRSFMVNAATQTHEVYQRAVNIGIMDNFYQFLLRFRYEPRRVLVQYTKPSAPSKIVLDYIDPNNPNELSLIVSPFPEGVLFFAMFRDMTPNQDIPSWNWAKFCFQNPWHGLCASLSRRIEYEEDMDDDVDSNSKSGDQDEDWANDIHVVNVPAWNGVLYLEHTPDSVRSMTLKGHSVRVNLESLRFSSLKELTLDFEIIIGLDIKGLSGLTLEILRLPSHPGLPPEDVNHVLNLLTSMRAQGEMQLDKLEFGRPDTAQKIIWYDPTEEDYGLYSC